MGEESMSAAERFDEMPEAIVEAFRRKPLMPFLELAALLRVNRTTLRDHVNAGDLPWRQKGLGTKAPRRVFTLADVAELFRNLRRKSERGQDKCQDQNDRSQSSASGAEILPFAARTSSDAGKPTSGISASSSGASGAVVPATPKTRPRRNRSPKQSKPKRKSKHTRIERPDLAR
jgi:hypothetical protein